MGEACLQGTWSIPCRHTFIEYWVVVNMFILLYQEEEEEEVPEFVAEDEIEESDLSDIEVSNLELETKPSQ